jgi:hypothetical protein
MILLVSNYINLFNFYIEIILKETPRYLYIPHPVPRHYGKTSRSRKDLWPTLRPPEPRPLRSACNRSTQKAQVPVLQLHPGQAPHLKWHLGMPQVHCKVHCTRLHHENRAGKTSKWLNTAASPVIRKLILHISRREFAARTAAARCSSRNAYALQSLRRDELNRFYNLPVRRANSAVI